MKGSTEKLIKVVKELDSSAYHPKTGLPPEAVIKNIIIESKVEIEDLVISGIDIRFLKLKLNDLETCLSELKIDFNRKTISELINWLNVRIDLLENKIKTSSAEHKEDYSNIFETDDAENLFYFLYRNWNNNADIKLAYLYNFFNNQEISHSNLEKPLINKLTYNKTDYFNFCRDNIEVSFNGSKIQFEKANSHKHYKKLNELYESFKNLN